MHEIQLAPLQNPIPPLKASQPRSHVRGIYTLVCCYVQEQGSAQQAALQEGQDGSGNLLDDCLSEYHEKYGSLQE